MRSDDKHGGPRHSALLADELTKLGYEVRLMPAKDVKAHVRRNKNDAADAEAICEAVAPPCVLYGSNRPGSRSVDASIEPAIC
jgi:hypothetical protein